MNEFYRHKKQEEEEKQKELNEKSEKLLIAVNIAICKFYKTFEIIITINKENGAIIPIRKVITPERFEISEAYRFLTMRNIEAPKKIFTFFPKRDFLQEVEKAEKNIGVVIAPSIKAGIFGIIPNYVVAERLKNPVETMPTNENLIVSKSHQG